jgi:hypothetical protein
MNNKTIKILKNNNKNKTSPTFFSLFPHPNMSPGSTMTILVKTPSSMFEIFQQPPM